MLGARDELRVAAVVVGPAVGAADACVSSCAAAAEGSLPAGVHQPGGAGERARAPPLLAAVAAGRAASARARDRRDRACAAAGRADGAGAERDGRAGRRRLRLDARKRRRADAARCGRQRDADLPRQDAQAIQGRARCIQLRARGARGSDARIHQGGDKIVEPVLSGPPIGIGEHQHVKLFGQLFDCGSKIIHLLTAIHGVPRNHRVCFDPGTLRHTFNNAAGGIFLRSQDEKDLVVLSFEFRQRNQVALEPRLDTLAWAEHGHARRVESGIRVQPPAHIGKPPHALPDEIGAEQNMDGCQ